MFLINIVLGADANNGDVDPTSIADLGTGVDPASIPHFDTIFEKVIYLASL
jgi:hypothetical protein